MSSRAKRKAAKRPQLAVVCPPPPVLDESGGVRSVRVTFDLDVGSFVDDYDIAATIEEVVNEEFNVDDPRGGVFVLDVGDVDVEHVRLRHDDYDFVPEGLPGAPSVEEGARWRAEREEKRRYHGKARPEEESKDVDLSARAEISAAHPLKTDRHDLYREAMRLVGPRKSRMDLTELVNWLLVRATAHGAGSHPFGTDSDAHYFDRKHLRELVDALLGDGTFDSPGGWEHDRAVAAARAARTS